MQYEHGHCLREANIQDATYCNGTIITMATTGNYI